MSTFVMPSLGADMEAGTLVEQLIAPGQLVKHGDLIGAVETQKGVIEMESFEEGILDRWLVDIGARVPVGTPLAVIRSPGESEQEPPDLPEPETPKEPPPEEPAPQDPTPDPAVPEYEPPRDPATPPGSPEFPPAPDLPDVEIPPPQEGRLRVTPAARRMAAERRIDLTQVKPGPDGTIARAQVRAAVMPAPDAATEMRAAIAAAMSRSKREIPHFYLSHRIDLTASDGFLRSTNKDRPPAERVLMGALIAKSVSRALVKYPEFNGHFEKGAFKQGRSVHIGMAIHIRTGGLVAPALLDVENTSLDGVMSNMRDLVTRVRAGRFRARELSDATITLTSLGDRGVDALYGVIYPPQVAIVGMGTPHMTPVVHDGAVTARLTCAVTLAGDHRVNDGHLGALFLRAIEKNLQQPESLC